MNEQTLFVEIDYAQEKKHGEEICGDSFAVKQIQERQRRIAVLSDGLGSGVKANILSCMTAEMALRFIASEMDVIESIKVIMDVLPVCEVRKISYSTLTIVDTLLLSGETRIIEMGNPPFIHLRKNEIVPAHHKEYTAAGWQNRTIRITTTSIEPEDRLIIFSDGVTQAGLGSENYPMGWREKGCLNYIHSIIKKNPYISAGKLSEDIIRRARYCEPDNLAHDDMTCSVLYFRYPRRTIVMTGPPFHTEQDATYAQDLLTFKGKKVICGGTTANIIARELNLPITTSIKRQGDLPSPSIMPGIDLVTEGILTLTRTYQLLKERDNYKDETAAAELVKLLRESDIIDFYVGTRINEAHQDPSLPRELEIRRNIIKKIKTVLEEQYLKEIHLYYI
ncbi:MAG: SpoIIE family protein phosphatase [Bacteroidota bacterium]|nr:SpoIIE family protein phosphatase [Bacteroidota bacterium]MDP4191730.1 SpoIIE family protein phosphatase [Bacteroidota bacterium]MDP4193490.1 SpoIIE family protein phosphatase [Bacteroidota bacterium]